MKAGRILAAAGVGFAAMLVARHGHASTSPFGIATPDSSGGGIGGFGGPLRPFFVWIALHQAEFYKSITNSLSAAKANGTTPWMLLVLSFAYGIFHAAGPGHGKAVISSYLLASGETARRGIVISFASAMVQACVAVAFVAVARLVLNVTAMKMTIATEWLEIGSYLLIVLVGAWLLWSKIRGGGHHHHHHHFFSGAARDHESHDHAHPAHAHEHERVEDGQTDDHAHTYVSTGHAHSGSEAHARHEHKSDGDHPHGHDCHEHRGHEHHATHGLAAQGANPISPGRALVNAVSTVLAVGIRPCSGAIIILVFAFSQGLFAAGVGATFLMAVGTGVTVAALATLAVSAKGLAMRVAAGGSGRAQKLMKGVEISGAAAVLVFGLLLLGGALATGLPS